MSLPLPRGIDVPTGLTTAVAAQRLKDEGPNELSQRGRSSLLALLGSLLREPMIALLVGTGVLYALIGDASEAITLGASVVFIVGLTLIQEWKTERAVSALKDLTSPRAQVIRDGESLRIPGSEVVRGDCLVVSEGDRVPADGRIVDAANVLVDESILTGESVPVAKRAVETDSGEASDADAPDEHVYSGTLVVRGRAVVEVLRTGRHAELGRIGSALADIDVERTPLQQQTARLVRWFAVVGIALCVMLLLWIGVTTGDWVQGLLAGLALAISMLPEEFPVILTVFLALGAFRMSRRNVLARRIAAVEALGATSVLCVDKTGTLTENRMRIAALWTPSMTWQVTEQPLPEAVHALVEYGILASQRDPFDPMERAFKQLGEASLAGTEHLHGDWHLVREYPLLPELLSMSHVWRAPDGNQLVVAAKGAPEAIVDLCHLPEVEAARVLDQATTLAAQGLRVLGVARAQQHQARPLPPGQHDFTFELVGLVGLADPVRPEVPNAVALCRAAGIRTLMITGDYAQTAIAIATQAGIDTEHVVVGAELRELSDDALQARLANASIVARAIPSDKLRIVRALQRAGEVVAMTGDGVNDAPALKAAHVGVAMGQRGTDVAREAAGLVLTDDNFASIVEGIRIGRRIFDNIRHATRYVLSVHVAIAGCALLPVLFGWPMFLLPVHIVFLELIIDPACSIAFEAEPEADDIMRRRPRSLTTPIVDRRGVWLSLTQGAFLLLAVIATLTWVRQQSLSPDAERAVGFMALMLGNIALIVVNRSHARGDAGSIAGRRALWIIVPAALLSLMATLTLPPLRTLFHFEPAPLLAYALAAVATLVSVGWIELARLARAR